MLLKKDNSFNTNASLVALFILFIYFSLSTKYEQKKMLFLYIILY